MPSIFRRPVKTEKIAAVVACTLFAAMVAAAAAVTMAQVMAKAALDLIF